MSYVRCPDCKTVVDARRGPRCSWCGQELKAAPPAAGPAFERQARRDTSVTTIVLAVFGAVGVFKLLLIIAAVGGAPPGFRIGAIVVLLGTAAAGALAMKARQPGTASVGKVMLGALAGVGVLMAATMALMVALVILLLVVCASGGMRF